MTDAVIVSTARTPLAKSWKGAFNMTHGATLGGHARAGTPSSAPASTRPRSRTCIMGCANPEGATGSNIARQIALRAGCPVTTAGMTVNRFCSSRPADDRAWPRSASSPAKATSIVAGGVEIDLVRAERDEQAHARRDLARRAQARDLLADAADRRARSPSATTSRASAGRVRRRAASSAPPRRATAGKFNDEIVPMTTTMGVADKATGAESTKEVTVAAGRRHPRRHDLRRRREDQAGDRRAA